MPSNEQQPEIGANSLHAQVAALKFPAFELPDLAPLLAVTETWRRNLEPLAELGQKISDSITAAVAPHHDWMRRIREQDKQCERLELLGWMPHASSPFHLVEEDPDDREALDTAIHAHYHGKWKTISKALASANKARDVDDEAKATFNEALTAHRAGLYRCAPRLLFPEIERVSRMEIHGGALDKMASQTQLVKAISHLTPAQMSSSGMTGLRFYRKLTKHLYLHLKNEEAVATVASDPVPNRHAAVHGIISYNSAKSSINSIIVADFLFGAISTIKRFEAAEDDDN